MSIKKVLRGWLKTLCAWPTIAPPPRSSRESRQLIQHGGYVESPPPVEHVEKPIASLLPPPGDRGWPDSGIKE